MNDPNSTGVPAAQPEESSVDIRNALMAHFAD